jgi:hypothetical protein
METQNTTSPDRYRAAGLVRDRIERGGERLWRFEDFDGQSFMAVAQALSRLAKSGYIERLSKGLYYKSRPTAFGKSRPNPVAIQKLASRDTPLFPSGLSAANLLGFTTQSARRSELATSASSLPRKLVGQDTVVHTLRPEAWTRLSEMDAALLDFLRQGGKTSEMPPAETIDKVCALLSEKDRYEHLVQIAATEPPRVRALLGAFGEHLKKDNRMLQNLRVSLNPLSRFDFGTFASLPTAKSWQAKEKHIREIV